MNVRRHDQGAEADGERRFRRRRAVVPSAALALVGLSVLSGCSGTAAETKTSIADACTGLKETVAEVSTTLQSTLSEARSPSELQADLERYMERVDSLAEKAQNPEVSGALATLSEALVGASDAVATLPTDAEGEVDPGALTEQRTGIQDAVDKVDAICDGSTTSSGG
jgi:TolA-binding protein